MPPGFAPRCQTLIDAPLRRMEAKKNQAIHLTREIGVVQEAMFKATDEVCIGAKLG